MTVVFRGSKGAAGGKSKTISRTPDNLRSADTMEVILGLGEGPWQGLVDDSKSFYVGETTLQNVSGESNFEGFNLEFLPGASPTEKVKPNLAGLASSTTVNVKVSKDVPVVRSGKIQNIDFLEVRLLFQTLMYQADSGANSNGSAVFSLEYKPSSSSVWTQAMRSTFTTTSQAQGNSTLVTSPVAANATSINVANSAGFAAGQYVDITWTTVQSYENGKGGTVTRDISHQVRRFIASTSTGVINLTAGVGEAIVTNALVVTHANEVTVDSVANVTVGDTAVINWAGNTFNSTITAIDITNKLLTFATSPSVTIPSGTSSAIALTITGITSSNYSKEIRFPVTNVADTYDIRLTKTFPADNDTHYLCEVHWESFQEVVAKTFSSTNLAMAHLTAQATDQFSSLPDFSGIYKMRIINVPSNYDPVARTYTGIWDGQFVKKHSNNNALVLYDFVMNDTFGMNAYYPITMDKWDIYEAAQWCDGMVSDGKGGLQPRFTFNLFTSDPQSAKDFARYIAGTFNAIFFDDGNGTAHVRVDKDDPAVAIFTPENVIDGKFSYSFTDINTRSNFLTVSFTNPELSWQEDRRIVKDQAHIDRYGMIPDDFIAVGCIDVQEATRRARYKLKTGTTETCTVTFKTNRVGQFAQQFDVILVSDPNLGYATSGRVTAINSNKSFSFRDAIYLEIGIGYQVVFQIPNPAYPTTADDPFQLVTLDVDPTTGSGSINTIKTLQALPDTLPDNPTFSLQQVNGQGLGLPKPFRVMRIAFNDDDHDNVEITALEMNRAKFSYMDTAVDPGEIEYSGFSNINSIPGPTDVAFIESFDRFTTSYLLKFVPTLNKSIYKLYNGRFQAWSRPIGGTSWTQLDVDASGTTRNPPPGDQEFVILPQNILGNYAEISQVGIFKYKVTNPSDPPDDVVGLHVNADNQAIWSYGTPPLDFAGFEIRYRTDDGDKWDGALPAHTGLVSSSPYSLSAVPSTTTTILIKAIDWFGNYSVNAKFVKASFANQAPVNILWTYDFVAAGFIGTKTNCSVSLSHLVADSDGSLMYTNAANKFYPGGPIYQSSFLHMSYVETVALPTGGYLSSVQNLVNATLSYRQMGLGPKYDGGGFYSGGGLMYDQTAPWVPFTSRPGVTSGTYQFKIESDASTQRGQVNSLAISVDVPDITEELLSIVVGAGGTRLPITKSYRAIKSVYPALLSDGGSGFTLRVIDKDPVLGPLMQVYDVSGAATSGTIDATVGGY
jgi:hypothetical protein